MPVSSVFAIRAHFPALDRRASGRPIAYFDGPGGTQVPRVVVDAMADYLYHHNANTHWRYPTSAETDEAIAAAREALADFLGGAPEEVAFGLNMTTLTFHLARGLGRLWGPRDEIVVTELDHHANVAPWRALERDRGVTVRMVRMRLEDGQLDWDDLSRTVTSRTRLVAIGAASNALGTINDVTRACDMARDAGALSFVDAVHYAPHALIDVRAMGCDFLACSAYKFYGPHIGVLWGRRSLLESVDVPRLDPAPNEAPERIETGTQNQEGIVGAAAAVDFLAGLAIEGGEGQGGGGSRRERLASTFAELHRRGDAQVARLWTGLASIEGVRLYGPKPGTPRTPTVSFTLPDVASGDVAAALAARGLFCSHGDFYAATIAERYGQAGEGFVRAGAACYTTGEEVDRLLEAVREVAVLGTSSRTSERSEQVSGSTSRV
jgi:cysteine desulfurase family protein (TIGR01976 family)